MVRDHQTAQRDIRLDEAAGAYVLVVRGPDGRLRSERYNDAAAYRARLSALGQSDNGSISIEEIVGLFDT